MCRIFKDNGLKITIDPKEKVIDYLDYTLDLRTGNYQPYKKPKDCLNYIHKESNHPLAIINNLPKGIELRLFEPKKETRKRNFTWFNPPFSKNVATNVGNTFFLPFYLYASHQIISYTKLSIRTR